MNKYQEEFIKDKLDNEMSRNERFALAKQFAEEARYETPLEMETLNELYKDKTPLEIIAEFCDDDFNVDDDYFMPDVGQGIKSMDNDAIDEWINDTISDCLSYKDADSLEIWDVEEYVEWLWENYPSCIDEAFPTSEDFPYSSDLYTHAEQFADRWRIELEILGCEYKKYFPGDEAKRCVFKCMLTNKHHEKYVFEWGQSLIKGDSKPEMYDILADLPKSYNGVKKEWEAVMRLFGPENGKCFEELCEIS